MHTKDLKILSYLRKDARMSLTVMSKKTSIPISTIFDKLKLFQDSVVKRYTSLLDFAKLGYATRASIMIAVEKDDKEQLKEFLMKNEHINSVFKINNGFDFMVEAVFREMKEMEEFLEKIDQRFSVKERKTFYIIDDLKREEFMSDASLLMG